jgi:ABC-type branched-subunit amino acid transport system ATPase component
MTLEATGITRRFGNLVALDNVSASLRKGEIHGLIGPNGSGKTTFLNILSGFYEPNAGDIAIDGRKISRATVQDRSALGIARTFQTPRILKTLSVVENVALGGWHQFHSSFLGAAFLSTRTRADQAKLRARASRVLDGIGMSALKDQRADILGHAEQRLLEIARCLCASPEFLLLDEPAGGLTHHDIANLERIVRVIAECGIGVLVIEHHMDFVFRVSDRVTTLDLGKVIASGTPEEVQNDENVRQVYLGL